MTIGEEIEQTRHPDPQEMEDNAPRPMMCGEPSHVNPGEYGVKCEVPSHPQLMPLLEDAKARMPDHIPFSTDFGIGAVDEMLRSYSIWLDRAIAMKEEKLSDPAMTVEVWRLMQGEIRGLRSARSEFMEKFHFRTRR